MKLWKTSILFVGVAMLLLSSMVVSAGKTEADPTGDVSHWKYATGHWGWNYNIGDKPNIDVTELSYLVNGDKLTLTLKVAGTIQSSELNSYLAFLNTSDASYWASWMEGNGSGIAMNIGNGSYNYDFEPEITVSGNTLSCTFDVVGSDYTNPELWGYATEYTESGDTTNSEWWGDWVPNEHEPFYGEDTTGGTTGGGDTGGDTTSGDNGNSQPPAPPGGTPGFETMTVIAAVGAALIILRRKK